ncbi:MAG: sugar transferase, partial [Patescibacteria group bacterium]
MTQRFRREGPALFAGDICFLALALWATLVVRYGTLPEAEAFIQHLVPFSLLFLLSALVFFISGLYEKHTLVFKVDLPQTIFYAQIANAAVGAIFFFLVPYFGIQPKTNLFIYLILSTAFVSFWRVVIYPRLSASPRISAVLVGEGEECAHLYREINGNNRYPFRFSTFIDRANPSSVPVRERVLAEVKSGASIVVLPFSYLEDGSFLPEWGNLMSGGVRFLDAAALYEDIFDRVGLSFLDQRWFLEESARARNALYRVLKRVMDVALSASALFFLVAPFVIIIAALKAGGGTAFIFQERVGRAGKRIKIVKFRSMLFDDGGDPEKQKSNRITRLGGILRKTQID